VEIPVPVIEFTDLRIESLVAAGMQRDYIGLWWYPAQGACEGFDTRWGKICVMSLSELIKAGKEMRKRVEASVKRTPLQRTA
jgi:hypothetical protein